MGVWGSPLCRQPPAGLSEGYNDPKGFKELHVPHNEQGNGFAGMFLALAPSPAQDTGFYSAVSLDFSGSV